MMSYFVKLTGEYLSRYLNKIVNRQIYEKLLLAPNRRSKCCKVFTFPGPTSWRPEQMAQVGMKKLPHCRTIIQTTWAKRLR